MPLPERKTVEGDADFHTRAEAEYVMHRFNEMLAQVRGDKARPVQPTY